MRGAALSLFSSRSSIAFLRSVSRIPIRYGQGRVLVDLLKCENSYRIRRLLVSMSISGSLLIKGRQY